MCNEKKRYLCILGMKDFLDNITHEVCRVARLAGEFISRSRVDFSPQRVEYKGEQNLVSYVDKEAERLILSELAKLLPEAKVLSEEGFSQLLSPLGDEYLWVVDPLDGTANFVHSMPPYCVSIALLKGREVLVGVIYEVTRDECFWAHKLSGCYLNGKQIRVSDVQRVQDSMVITGMAYNTPGGEESFLRAFSYFNVHTNGTRRIGSAAANLAYVAAGRAECFFQRGLSEWDVAAGVLLVERAGGIVCDYSGGDDVIFGREIIATNNNTNNKFVEIICENSF